MTRTTHLIALQEVIEAAVASGDGSPVYGFVRDEEGLLQVLSTNAAGGTFQQLGRVQQGKADGSPTFVLDDGSYCLKLDPEAPVPDSVTLVRAREEMDTRRTDLLSEGSLRDKTVVLFGAGSLGSKIGLLLAEAGVGQFFVVDHDRLDASNLSRHACDIADLGRSKARAVGELIQRRLGMAEIVEADILELSNAALDAVLGSADIAVATTDSPACQFVVNEACIRTNTPGLFAGAYERACGGEVILVQPGKSPCFFCAVGFRVNLGPIAPEERKQAYQSADSNQLMAESGLGADISYLSAIATAYALAVLDPEGMRIPLLDSNHGFTLVHGGSAPQGMYADLFDRPFDLIHARVSREDPCPVCGWVEAKVKEKERIS